MSANNCQAGNIAKVQALLSQDQLAVSDVVKLHVAGALLVAIGNALTILTLGIWAFETTHANRGTHVATTNNPHNYDAAANQAKREVETGTV